MLKLYVTRHGETEWNRQNRLQGHQNSPLTEAGISQAKLLGEYLQDVPFVKMISSPSKRALQTTDYLKFGRDLAVETDNRLNEICLGEWEGQTIDELKEKDPIQFGYYWNEPMMFKNPSGEDFYQVYDRVQAFLEDVAREVSTGNVLIVSHGVVVKMLLLICKRLPLSELWTPPWVSNTSLSVIEVTEAGFQLIVEGDLSYSM